MRILLHMCTAETRVEARKARANRDLAQAAPKERTRAKPTGERVEGEKRRTRRNGGARLFFVSLIIFQAIDFPRMIQSFFPAHVAAMPEETRMNVTPQLT